MSRETRGPFIISGWRGRPTEGRETLPCCPSRHPSPPPSHSGSPESLGARTWTRTSACPRRTRSTDTQVSRNKHGCITEGTPGPTGGHCRIFTRSCISFCSLAMAFLVPTAKTNVSMSSSLRVTLICYGQTDGGTEGAEPNLNHVNHNSHLKSSKRNTLNFTHHLVTGGPHHPGQNIEEVLPLQELQQTGRSAVRADASGDPLASVARPIIP